MRLLLNKTEYDMPKAVNLKHTSKNEVSFKGISSSKIVKTASKLVENKLFTSYSQKFNTQTALKNIRRNIGTSADILYEHIKADKLLKQGLIEDASTIQFKSKTPLRLFIDGVLYPIAKIPFYILYNGINKLKKFDAFKNSSLLKNFEKTSFYKLTHSYMKKDDKLNALKGLMEIGSRANVMGARTRAKAFLYNTAKTFDSTAGNYNSVHERALTRIVTGFIPAFFLANDAHNLSMLCNNDKKEAQTEKKLRFKQETSRVLSNAYIQLITLGALSKFINKSKTWFVGVTVVTVLLTEVYSRLRLGKKIHFINSEEAKEINRQERQKHVQRQMEKGLSLVLDRSPEALNVKLNGINNFIQNPNSNKFKDLDRILNKPAPQKKGSNKSRSIISAGNFVKAVVALALAGFALKGLKKVPFGKGHVGDLFSSIAKGYKNIYEKITMKKNLIQKTDMDKIITKMQQCGFGTIADSYKKVIEDYQKINLFPKQINSKFVEAVRKTGNTTLADCLSDFASGKNKSGIIKSIKEDVISHNFEVFKRYLKKSNQTELLSSINKINQNGEINYPKLHKLFGKAENEKYRELFENLFAVDDNTLLKGMLSKSKLALLKSGNEQIWNEAERKVIEQINNATNYDLGKCKKPIVKDIVDFCIEPFKFAWKYISLPYRTVSHVMFDLNKVTPRSAANDIEAVSNALSTLLKRSKMTDKAFTNMFNENIVKGFNSITMSKIKNSELSALAKNASTIATMSFLITDNYNMVMIKSNGEDKDEATTKGKERFVQEMSRFFWQQLFINLFNNTFSKTYNASLLGASAVNTASTTIGEICTRKAVSMPISASSKEEIIQLEKENLSGDGIKSKFFRFMSKLTGKQILSEREAHIKHHKKHLFD